MGGHLDRFVVRFVLAFTIVAWASVLAHDAMDGDAAESLAPTSAQAAEEPTPVATVTVPPTNGTPAARPPPDALAALMASA